jgi:broad specificity phosphatase PhoE
VHPGQAPPTLLFVRHGETPDNRAGLILGHRDPPLTPRGRRQAAELAPRLAGLGIAALWTSPLRRARETAEILGAQLGIAPQELEALMESDRGAWEGRRVADLAVEDPAGHAAFEAGAADFAFPGGESLASQQQRTRAALDVICAGALPAVVVAHVGTIRAALAIFGRPVPPERLVPHGEPVRLPAQEYGPPKPLGAGEPV